jgi:hypothetical protein
VYGLPGAYEILGTGELVKKNDSADKKDDKTANQGAITTLNQDDKSKLDAKFTEMIDKMKAAKATAEQLSQAESAKRLASEGRLAESAETLSKIHIASEISSADKGKVVAAYDGLIKELRPCTTATGQYCTADQRYAPAATELVKSSQTAFNAGNYAKAADEFSKAEAQLQQYDTWAGGFTRTRAYVSQTADVLNPTFVASAANVADTNEAVASLAKELNSGKLAMSSVRTTQFVYGLTKSRIPIAQARADLKAKLDECETAYQVLDKRETESLKAEKTKLISTGVGAVVGGVAGGILTAQITQSVQKANAEGAAKQWLEDVGKHIRCYIGSDEVGEFGDIISTSLE